MRFDTLSKPQLASIATGVSRLGLKTRSARSVRPPLVAPSILLAFALVIIFVRLKLPAILTHAIV
jgi:hypothetical protein